MAKYIITTNMDKLPGNVLSVLVENGCSIEKCSANDDASDTIEYINRLRSEIEADKKKFDAMQESPKAVAVRLLAEAKRFVKVNPDKFGYFGSSTCEAIDSAASYVGKGDFKYAYNDINYCSHLAKNFDKYPELMSALAELI